MRTPVRPGVYVGSLRHRRTAPVTHAFTYPLFMVLLDIDRIPELMRASAVHELQPVELGVVPRRGPPRRPVAARCGSGSRGTRRAAGTVAAGRPHLPADAPALPGLLLQPGVVLLLLRHGGALRLDPRGGEQHLRRLAHITGSSQTPCTVSPGTGNASGASVPIATKSFYVSPFMPADMRYAFAFTEPGDRLVAHMALERCTATRDAARVRRDARCSTTGHGMRANCDGRLLRHPFMTANGHRRHPLAGAAALVEGTAHRPAQHARRCVSRLLPCPMRAGHEQMMTMIDTLAKKSCCRGFRPCRAEPLTLLNRVRPRALRRRHRASHGRRARAARRHACGARRSLLPPRLLGSDIGIGEAYMDGDWTTPDLVSLTRLMIRNLALVEQKGGLVRGLMRLAGGIARRLRDNSLTGSRQHIREHYDLGNDFFRLFLDDNLMYSSAYYETGRESLEQAQQKKLDAICRKLALGPGRSRAGDRHRLGRLRGLGRDALRLPRHHDDDQRRAVSARMRLGGAPRRRGVAHFGAARPTTASWRGSSTRSSASRCSRRSG